MTKTTKLIAKDDGRVLAEDLTAREAEQLQREGVEFDWEDADGDGGAADGQEVTSEDNPDAIINDLRKPEDTEGGGGGGGGTGPTPPSDDSDTDDEDGESDGDEEGEAGEDGEEQATGTGDDEGDAGAAGGDEEEDGDGEDDAATTEDDGEEDGEGDEATREDADREYDPEGHLEEMREMDEERDAGEWNGLDTDEPFIEPGEDFERMHRRFMRESTKMSVNVEELKDERQSHREEYKCRVTGQTVKEYMRSSGLKDDIVEAFRQFKTNDRVVAGRKGKRLNHRRTVRRISGDTSEKRLYDRKRKAEIGDRVIGVAVDNSGSMREGMKTTKTAIASIAAATEEIGDKFACVGWATDDKHGHDQKIDLVTGPDEDFRYRQLNAMTSHYQDPITLGMAATENLIERTTAGERVMIVITDGCPLVTSFEKTKERGGCDQTDVDYGDPPCDEDGCYGDHSTEGERARMEAKGKVEQMRNDGIKVIGLGTGGVAEEHLEEMFGEGNYVRVDRDEMADELVEIYRNQMSVNPR